MKPNHRARRLPLPSAPQDRLYVPVTAPVMPDKDAFIERLSTLWEDRWLTNQGRYARELEATLARWLGVPRVALMTNGEVALEIMIRSAIAGGEVIVPAWSFPATWTMLADDARYKPIFVDIDPQTFCVDPDAVAAAITPRTTAILGVHAYGFPCDHERLQAIAASARVPLLYDAAHTFGASLHGVPLAALGDMAALSFHATKVFNTLEGGAVVGRGARMDQVAQRRNFGLRPDGTQAYFGQNGKVDEFRALFGLMTLEKVAEAIAIRAEVTAAYRERFAALGVDEVVVPTWMMDRPGFSWNHAYFPVRFLRRHNTDRDVVDQALRDNGILARRYFVDVLNNSQIYAGKFDPAAIRHCRQAGDEVLCLPIHHDLGEADIDEIVGVVASAYGARRA